MRVARVLLASAATLLGASACADMAAYSGGVWIEVSPATVTAGSQVSIRASCGETVNSATVISRAFGTVTVAPVEGVLVAQVTVPDSTAKAMYDVRLNCPTGSHATTTLTVVNATVVNATTAQSQATTTAHSQATLGPHSGGGFLANGGRGFVDRGPLAWLAIGLTSLLAAAVVTVRTKRRNRRRAGPPVQPDTPVVVAAERR